jgi:hypothetical protein
MTLLLTVVDWLCAIFFMIMVAAMCLVWFYFLRGVYEAVRAFFLAVRKYCKG